MKIGVYICHCGINIAATVDVEEVREYISKLPNVVVCKDYRYMCSDPGQSLIQEDIKEYGLDRVVVASCSPRMHEPTFRETLKEAGLNPYCLDMANIREHCSWVHADKEKATEKAKALVAASVEKSLLLEPLKETEMEVVQEALVIGGGIAGIQAALDIANAGYKVYLVERSPSIGGHMAQLDKTFPTLDCSACILTPKMVDVARHPNIELITYAEVEDIAGYVGNFKVKVRKKAKSIDESLCTGCGACWDNCPVRYKAYIEPPKIEIKLEEEEQGIADEIINKYKGERGAVMPILEDINDKFSYLPGEMLRYVAVQLDFPLSSIYRMATFYNAFSLKPRGRHLINVCMGTTCHVRGAPRILERIERELKIGIGETTEDLRFTLETVRCLGCCSLAPVIAIDGETFGRLRPDKIPKVLDQYD